VKKLLRTLEDGRELRRRAKLRLRQHGAQGLRIESKADTQRLLQELQIHHIELELQNEELKQAKAEVDAALERYTDLYDFAPVGYFTLSADGAIHQVNLTGTRLVGVDRARLMGRNFKLLISEPFRSAFVSFLKQVFAGHARQSGDFELLLPGQPSRTIHIETQHALQADRCLAAVVDVTDRMRQENELRVSEIRYRRLFEAAHDGVLLLDPGTGKITDANPFMTKLLGYPMDQLVGKELYEIGLLKDEAASREMFQQLKKNHEVRYEDLPLESQGGRHQEVEVVANLYQENGHSVIQCNIRDITERKRAEEMLRRNEALFAALVRQAPVGVYLVDARLRLQQINPKALPVFKNLQPLIGRSLSEIMHALWPPRVADQVLERFRHTLETGAAYHAPEFAERRHDTGEKEIYEWQIQRVTLPAGEHGVVCFFDNITERKRAEEAQRRLDVVTASNRKLQQEIVRRRRIEKALKRTEQHQTRLLEESRQMHEQLRHLSHQFLCAQEEERKRISRELHDVIAQTVVGINVHLAALSREGFATPGKIQRKLAETQQMARKSVDAIHQFARELRPMVLDDLGLIPALHAHLKEFTQRTGVRASLRAFAGIEQADIANRTILYRVAQEALNNVASHAQATRVRVSLEKRRSRILMEIEDDGKSFDLERVMQSRGKGRLGLLGMRERLEMVGGSFAIQSAPGKGTTVIAQIPTGKTARGGRRKTR